MYNGYFDNELCKRTIENIDKSSIYPVDMICVNMDVSETAKARFREIFGSINYNNPRPE